MPWAYPVITNLQRLFPGLPWPGILVRAIVLTDEEEAAVDTEIVGFAPYRPAKDEVIHTANATGQSGQAYKLFYWPEHNVWSVHYFQTEEPATLKTFATRDDAKAWAQSH